MVNKMKTQHYVCISFYYKSFLKADAKKNPFCLNSWHIPFILHLRLKNIILRTFKTPPSENWETKIAIDSSFYPRSWCCWPSCQEDMVSELFFRHRWWIYSSPFTLSVPSLYNLELTFAWQLPGLWRIPAVVLGNAQQVELDSIMQRFGTTFLWEYLWCLFENKTHHSSIRPHAGTSCPGMLLWWPNRRARDEDSVTL